MKFAFALAFLLIMQSSGARAALNCDKLPGWSLLYKNPDIDWFIFGEQHGNNESPESFAQAICEASKQRSIVVGVEHSERDQAAIDEFMSSDGGKGARQKFLGSMIWDGHPDGRTSEAMFELFERLRGLKLAGRITRVFAYIPYSPDTHFDQAHYEEKMANRIKAEHEDGKIVVVLTGNVHAMRTKAPWNPNYFPMATHLPKGKTVTLAIVTDGGTSWGCQGQPVRCDVYELPSSPQPRTRELIFHPYGDTPYSGTLFTGSPATASLPAKGSTRPSS